MTRGQMATLVGRLVSRQQQMSAPVAWGRVSTDVPDVALVEARSGRLVTLRSVVEASGPVLLWFVSPL